MRVWILSAAVLLAGCDGATKSGAGGSGSSVAGPAKGSSGAAATVAAAPVASVPAASTAAPAGAASTGEVKLVVKNVEEIQALVASKKGKVVVLDAWSTSCPPCMTAFPGLVALHKKYGPEKLACISLCADYTGLGKPEESMELPLEFLKEQKATFDNILSAEPDETLYKKMQFGSVPCIFVYDADGKLVKKFAVETTYDKVEEVVKPLIK